MASSSSSASKILTLKSSDEEIFEITEAAALRSQAIKHMIEDSCVDDVIPLQAVKGKILAKVITFCNKRVEFESKGDDDFSKEELKTWDAEFLDVDQETLFELICAANYLEIKDLFHVACQIVADMVKGKTPEEIRRTFNIKNDLTREEQEKVFKMNRWAFPPRRGDGRGR